MLRSDEEVQMARGVVIEAASRKGVGNEQKILLMGMSVALQWVQCAGGTTLQRLLDGEQMTVEQPTAQHYLGKRDDS